MKTLRKTLLVFAIVAMNFAEPALAADTLPYRATLAKDNYLLIDQAGIDAVKRKAETQPWAKRALDANLARAKRDVKRKVDLPPRGGQWGHWYSCKKDGARLVTDSPTSHRCPICGAVYHGEPYDSVVFSAAHSKWSQTVRDLGLAYRFTGRKEFADKAGEVLLAYADRYADYPLHDKDGKEKVGGGHIMAQTLDESVWLIPVAFGYVLVRDALPSESRTHIENDLLRAAADVIRRHKMGIHNIQCWKNSAVGLAGFAAGDDSLVREAIDDRDRGFRAQIAQGVTDDGLWYEGSLGYHRYTMEALWPLAEAARLQGIDLYSDRYRTMFEAPLALALPDGQAPGFNDNDGGNIRTAAPLYELAFARWQRPEFGRLASTSDRNNLQALLYGADTLPRGPVIPTASVLMKNAGFAVLRAQGNAVAVRFGKHGGWHGHLDKLGIVTFAGGKLLGLDPGSIHYGVPLHREWYRTTIAHNTVAVDGKDQAAVDGELDAWSDGHLAAHVSTAYPGVELRRTLDFDGAALRDRFECSSNKDHDYDYAFHCPGKFSTSLALKPRGPLEYAHVEKVSDARPDGDWWCQWEQGGERYRLRFKGSPGTVVYTAVAPGRNPADRVPMIIVRRHGTQTVFECVHAFGEMSP
jgi:hypothetical protein